VNRWGYGSTAMPQVDICEPYDVGEALLVIKIMKAGCHTKDIRGPAHSVWSCFVTLRP